MVDLSASSGPPTRLEEICPDWQELLAGVSLGYGPSGGSAELREAVGGLYGLSAENVLITAGAMEAIRVATRSLIAPARPFLVQEPSYLAMRQCGVEAGGVPVALTAGANHDFDLDALSSDGRPDVALLNSPHGPTGSLVRGLERARGRLVVDEVYRPISLVAGQSLPSAVDLSEDAVAIGDLSKPLGLGGLRIGWLVSRDRDLMARCRDAVEFVTGSVSVLSAPIALQAVRRWHELLEPRLTLARANLSRLAAFVERHRDWLDWTAPQAGYTATLRFRATPPGSDFYARLAAQGIFLLDGAAFDMPGHIRIGLGMDEAVFAGALQSLSQQIQELPTTDALQEDVHCILFSKLPRPGHGKSRLAAEIGVETGARLAGAFLQDTVNMTQRETARLFVSFEAGDADIDAERLFGTPDVYPQSGFDLGERLSSAFDEAFRRGARNPVLVGSDSPTLPGHLLAMASRALTTHDVVLGPARDGGYYALGLRQPQPAIFKDITWSTSQVLEQTLARCREQNLRVFFLPTWYDVDTAADLAVANRDLEFSPVTASLVHGFDGAAQ